MNSLVIVKNDITHDDRLSILPSSDMTHGPPFNFPIVRSISTKFGIPFNVMSLIFIPPPPKKKKRKEIFDVLLGIISIQNAD